MLAVWRTPVSMYMLNTEFLKMVFDSDANFTMGDFETVTGYASRSANIMTRCQLVTDHLVPGSSYQR
jgi:hypothetical protein